MDLPSDCCIPWRLVADRRIKTRALRVYLALERRLAAGQDRISYDELAADLGFQAAPVRAHLRNLQRYGWVGSRGFQSAGDEAALPREWWLKEPDETAVLAS